MYKILRKDCNSDGLWRIITTFPNSKGYLDAFEKRFLLAVCPFLQSWPLSGSVTNLFHLQGLSNSFFSNRRRMSLVKGSDTVKKTSLCGDLIPYSVIQEDDNYTMYHSDKEAPLILFMSLDSNSNMLKGSVSERLIYRRKGLGLDMRYC